MAQYVRLVGPSQRVLAKQLIDRAPLNALVKISEQKRTDEQSAKMWAMLSDISRAMPDGKRKSPEAWKGIAMHTLGLEVQFETDFNDRVFPLGLSSRRLTVRQMSDLIELLYAYGAEKGVVWSEPEPAYEGRE
jgi:hypothetical protein